MDKNAKELGRYTNYIRNINWDVTGIDVEYNWEGKIRIRCDAI